MQSLIDRVRREHRFTAFLVAHDVQEAVSLGYCIVLIEQIRIMLDTEVGAAASARSHGHAFL
ncbi:hypothetical protein [Paraburkholderia sp. HD33-4]|uniref:hypothetical protein n=1 Tax=Paraburkholderia sp. HD33-4 TaxID=2883242 RepID=UPI001F36E2ED|nr:hypothetical protein [Paraburkholderia sp. HD33-4]